MLRTCSMIAASIVVPEPANGSNTIPPHLPWAYIIAYIACMSAINATTARKTLFKLIRRANDDAETFEITSPGGNVFMVPEAEYRSMQETAYLLRSPANARTLRQSIAEAEGGRLVHPGEAADGGFE